MRRVYLLVSALLLTVGLFTPRQAAAQGGPLCFNVPGITDCIEGRFHEYWAQNGGLQVFGYPISPATMQQTAEGTFLTQYFERNRFELHPEKARPYDVLLGRLGDDRLKQLGRDWFGFPKGQPTEGCLWFGETGHSVCDQEGGVGFRSYWEGHGLQDPALSQYARSLALFGLPLSEPALETNEAGDTVLTQWFERARFEWHPGQPREFKVLLGLLGNETRDAAAEPAGISGQVRVRGAAAGGVTLRLRHCDNDQCTSIAETTTDNSGNYTFTDVPALPAGKAYYVHFLNGPEGGNSDDPGRLVFWAGPDINSYSAGSRASGGSFDIADVVLESPEDDAALPLPATFSWAGRGIADDRYSLAFADQSGEELCYMPLSATASFTLGEAERAECKMSFDTPY